MKAIQPVLSSLPSDGETWQLVSGLEAILILVLFVGWISSSGITNPNDDDREVPP